MIENFMLFALNLPLYSVSSFLSTKFVIDNLQILFATDLAIWKSGTSAVF